MHALTLRLPGPDFAGKEVTVPTLFVVVVGDDVEEVVEHDNLVVFLGINPENVPSLSVVFVLGRLKTK